MIRLESCALAYFLNSLWQVPLFFAAGWLAAHALRRLGAAAEHRLWVGVVLLQAAVPALSLLPLQGLPGLLAWGSARSRNGRVTIFMGPGSATGGLPLPPALLHAAAFVSLAAAAWFALRLLWRCLSLRALSHDALFDAIPAPVLNLWQQCCRRFGLARATLAASPRLFGPVTLGIRRSLVLLPVRMLDGLPDTDLRTMLAHECAHIRRRDFLLNLLYAAVAIPVSYHPFHWAARARLVETREMVCDRIAACLCGRRHYAQSLLRLAALLVCPVPAVVPQAIGIFDTRTLERRLMKLTENHAPLGAARRTALLLLCACFGLVTCASALAVRVHIGGLTAALGSSHTAHVVHVSSGVMQAQRIGGPMPVYPPDAKKAGIEGTVVLAATIGTDGTVEHLTVQSGPSALQKSALEAVRQWTYKPFLLNGEPVEVETTINVVYSLQK